MINVTDLEIKYGDFTAVHGIDFHVEEGDFFYAAWSFRLWENNDFAGHCWFFLNPSRGQVSVDDKDVTNVPVEKREIGIVFQSYALFPTMTVYDNIAYGLKVARMERQKK